MFTIELSLSFILKTLALLLVQYYIISVVYNVFFHPLRTYPGPRYMAASRVPIVYGTIMGTSVAWLASLHAKYGPVVRVAPGELSYCNASAWKDIYGSNPSRPGGMQRDMTFFRAVEDQKGIHSILSANNEDHARIRRMYGQAFSKRALSAQEPLILGHVSRMMEKLHADRDKPIDIVEMFNFTLFDIMGDLQFGESLHLLDEPTYHPWVRSHLGVIRSASLLAALSDFPLLNFIFQLTLPKLVKTERESYFGMLNKKLDERLAGGMKRPDLVHFVMEARGEEDGISEGELRATAPIVMMAGSETSSTALSGFMAHMLNEPEIFKQVQGEVRSKFRNSSDISMNTMGKMPLLDACVKETLRAYAAVPGVLPRIVPSSGATVSGQWVSGGTRVYVTPLAAFRSTDNFHDPESFSPQRWFTETEDKFSMDSRDACKPFSVGPRDCVGQYMAQYMMSLILCNLMLHFDFKPFPETESTAWFSNQKVWTIWDKPPLMVKLTPTEASQK